MLSGIELNLNGPATNTTTANQEYSQTFHLPRNYLRGSRIPDITGFQFCQDIDDASTPTLDVTLEVNIQGTWRFLHHENIQGSHAAGTYVWTDVHFAEPVALDQDWITHQFRVRVISSTSIWYSVPSVLPSETGPGGGTLRFRLLADTADSGTDFLGNKFRSVVVRNKVENVNSKDTQNADTYWLSRPNPSQFAVESLYFDLRAIDNRTTVVDRIFLDPITPGILFHVYYTDEGDPGTNDSEWEDKLWTPVTQTFSADRRQEHALPYPITARYLKIEFCHLQPQHYSPGTFAQPTTYKKHPKWVLDYFLALGSEEVTDDPFIARRIAVIYDAYDLAFNYYLDDLKQAPTQPDQTITPSQVNAFFAEREDVSDQVDSTTQQRIRVSLKPYQDNPGSLAKGLDYLPGLYTGSISDSNYPTERVNRAIADTSSVSTLDRSSLVVEQNYPAMFFYLRSRHKYREVSASFREDRAYFAGIRELALIRDQYSVASDNDLYIEPLADFTNVIRNDFIEDGLPPIPKGPGA